MKKIALLIYLPVLLLSGNLKNALLKAKREHKPVMVYVKAEACQFCEKMKEETLHDPEIQASIQDFIFVAADKSSSEARKYLPKTRYTPTVYFISSKFKVVNQVKGYLGKDDFALWIDDTKNKLGISTNVHAVYSEVIPKNDVWMYDIASARDFAAQTGKEVLIYVENRNDRWSKKMRTKTLDNSKVKKALNNFIWVKLQKNGSEAEAYGLRPRYAPTVYFQRSDGSQLAKAEGYFGVNDFMKWVRYAKSRR